MLFRVICFVIVLIPLNIAVILGRYLGRACFYILKKERQKALQNLGLAFADKKSLKEKEIIAKKVFENLGRNVVEIISIPKFNKRNIDKYVTCEGQEILREFFVNKKPCIILSAHFGNWELLAHYLAMKFGPINVIARRVREAVFEGFLSKMRRNNGIKILYRDASAKEILNLLKNYQIVAMMPDQDMDGVSGVFVDFFGKPAYTPDGPSVMALLTGAPIVPLFITHKNSGYEIFINEPMQINKTQDKKKDILRFTQEYTSIIEGYIRKYPSEWVWFHNRWKTQKTDGR